MRARGVVVAGLVALVALGLPLPSLASGPAAKGCARHLLDAPASGTEALDAVGDDLPQAAALGGQSTAELAQTLRDDPTAWLDRCGRSYYVEPDVAETAADVTATLTGLTSSVDPSTAFALHSRPGSLRVLYLDFDGQVLSGTGWNDDFANGAAISAAPYDTDGNPGSFSAAERAAVVAVWQRVSEDYAPFDLDVTTADPGDAAIDRAGSSDTRFGTRALITNTSLACGGCSGIAYVGVFDSSYQHGYTQPALAFSSTVSGSAKLVAEIVSHEVGHNFGLDHDGTATSGYSSGHGAWSPIMGAATSRPISQWSDGDYAGANNQQDDLAVIAAGGAPLLPDDHGGSAATATPLQGVPVTGVISNRSDSDWFSFTTSGGQVTVAATPSSVGADLDLSVDLLDSNGTTVASSDPASSTGYLDPPSGLASNLSVALLPAGDYVVRVDGVGSGDPLGTGYSDYGSIGRYSVAVTAPVLALPLSVPAAPLAEATVGTPLTTSLPVVGGQAPYTWSLTGGALPSGVTLLPDGSLAGAPTETGTFAFTTDVTDATATAPGSWSLVVRDPVSVGTTALPPGTKGSAYAAPLTATGGTGTFAWTGTAPAGLTLTSLGVLTGTPTVTGTFPVSVTAHDGAGRTATRALSLVVRTPLSVATGVLPAATRGRPYAVQLAGAGGLAPYTWSATGLPAGLSLSPAGRLSGTPASAGSFAPVLHVTDAAGTPAARRLALRVNLPPVVATTALPSGHRGSGYSTRVAATAGTPSLVWRLYAGALPTGVHLSSTGVLSGTPTVSTVRNLTFQVTDARGAVARRTIALRIG